MADVTADHLARVLDALDETADEIESVTVGRERVCTIDAVRRWLRSRNEADTTILDFVNGTGIYGEPE